MIEFFYRGGRGRGAAFEWIRHRRQDPLVSNDPCKVVLTKGKWALPRLPAWASPWGLTRLERPPGDRGLHALPVLVAWREGGRAESARALPRQIYWTKPIRVLAIPPRGSSWWASRPPRTAGTARVASSRETARGTFSRITPPYGLREPGPLAGPRRRARARRRLRHRGRALRAARQPPHPRGVRDVPPLGWNAYRSPSEPEGRTRARRPRL